MGTVRVVDEKDIEWHGADPAMVQEILARGVTFTPEGLHFVNFRPQSGAGYLSKDEFVARRSSGAA